MVVLGLVGLCFCCLCLFVSVNSVVHWLVVYCIYDLVASFSAFDLIVSCWFVVVCICLSGCFCFDCDWLLVVALFWCMMGSCVV